MNDKTFFAMFLTGLAFGAVGLSGMLWKLFLNDWMLGCLATGALLFTLSISLARIYEDDDKPPTPPASPATP